MVYKQLYNEPPDNQTVETPLQVPNEEDVRKKRSFFNRFQQIPAHEAADAADPRPVPETSGTAVASAWAAFKSSLMVQVYAYLMGAAPADDVEPLEFWAKFGMAQYPMLVVPARYYLSIFASQATAERTFSTSGARQRLGSGNLSPVMLARLTQAHVNYRSVMQSKARRAQLERSGSSSDFSTPPKRKAAELEEGEDSEC
ncbi:unnamed protein product [Symbiodinium sp. CCMP2592]|nr:unnamed protein product [Symbiodinium sp. CCMP2592]